MEKIKIDKKKMKRQRIPVSKRPSKVIIPKTAYKRKNGKKIENPLD